MLGFMFGTFCLIGLVGLAARGPGWRHAHAHRERRGHYGHGPWRHGSRSDDAAPDDRPGWQWSGRAKDVAATKVRRGLRHRLGLDADQDELVGAAVGDLAETVEALVESLRDGRGQVADALRGEAFDAVRLQTLFDEQDEAVAEARKGAVSALRRVHAALDPDQREKLAEWLGGRA